MSKNPGKIFEEDFKKSVPESVYYLRLHDAAIGFDTKNSTGRFSLKSPYDCIMCKEGQMYCFELKSTKSSSFSFDGKTPYIKLDQIKELLKASKSGAKAFLILNFRKYGITYAIKPEDFLDFCDNTNKKSINKPDAASIGIIIEETKKRSHYRYDLESFLSTI